MLGYWSRSRAKLGRKGESSGQTQRLVELRVDCDGDTLLLRVDQKGVACHTGRRACFYRRLAADGSLEEILPVVVDPGDLYGSSDLHGPSALPGELHMSRLATLLVSFGRLQIGRAACGD